MCDTHRHAGLSHFQKYDSSGRKQSICLHYDRTSPLNCVYIFILPLILSHSKIPETNKTLLK